MENFIPISRELTNSLLWRNLSDKEYRIAMNLITSAPFKATTYNLYGIDIELEKHELCFSTNKLAEKYDTTDHFLRRLFDKLAKHNILVKKKRKIAPTTGDNKSHIKCCKSHQYSKLNFVTSITFCGWVFGEKEEVSPFEEKITTNVAPKVTSKVAHNKEVIKEEEKKEEKEKKHKSACAQADFFSSPSGNEKIWYPVEQIANLEFPNAEEVLRTWREFSGQTNLLIKPLLHKYCNEQKLIDIHQMTLDVFDYRFRKYMTKSFKPNPKTKKVEPVRRINYL